MIAAVWHSAQLSTLVPYISNANLCAAISSVCRHSLISVGFYLGLWYAVPYEARLATIHIRSWSFPLLPAAKCELGLQHHKKQSMILHWVTVPESQTYRCAVGAAIIFPAANLHRLSASLRTFTNRLLLVTQNIFEKFRAQDHKIFFAARVKNIYRQKACVILHYTLHSPLLDCSVKIKGAPARKFNPQTLQNHDSSLFQLKLLRLQRKRPAP